jgi:hypothetical protein
MGHHRSEIPHRKAEDKKEAKEIKKPSKTTQTKQVKQENKQMGFRIASV